MAVRSSMSGNRGRNPQRRNPFKDSSPHHLVPVQAMVFSAGKGRTRRMFSKTRRDVFNHMKTSALVPFPKSLVKRERAAYRENLSELAEISANIKA